MSTFTNYLIVTLIILILLLTFTYSTDYLQLNNLLTQETESSENFSYSSDTEYEKEKNIEKSKNNENINDFLIDNNFATIDSDNINKQLFLNTDEYQMTENTNNAISNALRNI
jgi:hypothetical protein